MFKKINRIRSVLKHQGPVLEIDSRETLERPWHRMGSWRLVCQSKTISFGAFWYIKQEAANRRLVDSETHMARLRLKDARLHNQNHGCETMMELHDRGMRFDRLATHDTGLAPHELLDARLPNKNNRF